MASMFMDLGVTFQPSLQLASDSSFCGLPLVPTFNASSLNPKLIASLPMASYGYTISDATRRCGVPTTYRSRVRCERPSCGPFASHARHQRTRSRAIQMPKNCTPTQALPRALARAALASAKMTDVLPARVTQTSQCTVLTPQMMVRLCMVNLKRTREPQPGSSVVASRLWCMSWRHTSTRPCR